MALITGTAGDINLTAVEAYGLELVFWLNEPASQGAKLIITREYIVAVADDGTWTIGVPDTETMSQPRHYKMRAQWRDPNAFGDDRGMAGVDFPDFELFVPVAGGSFAELTEHFTTNPYMVFYQATEPASWPVGSVWVNSITGDMNQKAA